jgi:hypothetical protein
MRGVGQERSNGSARIAVRGSAARRPRAVAAEPPVTPLARVGQHGPHSTLSVLVAADRGASARFASHAAVSAAETTVPAPSDRISTTARN